MIFEEFKEQLPDSDPLETREWMDSLDEVVQRAGADRAQFLLYKVLKRAKQLNLGLPPTTQTRYINTISPEQEPDFPGDEAMERRIRRLIRWNAVAMVTRANNHYAGLGGHLSSYASAASLYEVGFNHFFRGKDDNGTGDLIFFQGHASPGIYARAFLEGRFDEAQLDRFRREAFAPGLSSYPHPRLMPDFWEFPTVSMGLGPLNAIYQARFLRYLQNRGIADTSGRRVWAFLGDGETDEPESLAALRLASREGLDNLIFVVNCNLQRLDGPVRGNGKIIQELEACVPRRRLERLQGDLGPGVGRAAEERPGRTAGETDGRHPGRRLPALPRGDRGLHPRALLRPGAGTAEAGGAPGRRTAETAAPRWARLPQALRRIQGGHRNRRAALGDPGQDGQGLDPG